MLFLQLNRLVSRAGAVLMLAWLAPLAGCTLEDEENHGSFERVPTVEIQRLEPELLRDTALFGGQLGSESSVMLKSEVEGIVAAIEFQEGQRVEEGAVLVRLRSDEQGARLREAEANLSLAVADAKRAEQLITRNATAQSKRDQAVAKLGVAQARLELARVALQRTRIRAPFDGVVGMRLVAPGDLVTDKDSLVQIDAVDRLQAYFAMSEFLLPFAKVGFPVEVMVSPYPGERFPGKVFFVSPTLETNSRRIMVKAWVPNGHGKLAAGLYANIEVEIRRQENALILPESAVVADRLGTFVWRIDDDELAERVAIEVGLRKEGKVEVTRGLHAGDRIVTAGTHKVSVGKKVATAAPLPSGQASAQTEGEAGEGT